jgi:peptidoglycan/LPS O-acetylase OafA/YrhL
MQGLVVWGAASLLSFNLDADLDVWAIYFMGAYGVGMMAFWAVAADKRLTAWSWGLLIAALIIGALVYEWRDRISLAGATALLWSWHAQPPLRWQGWAPLRRLGEISYSVFLIHFSICLLVNAVVNHFWHGSVPPRWWASRCLCAFTDCRLRAVSTGGAPCFAGTGPALAASLVGTGLLTTMVAGLR